MLDVVILGGGFAGLAAAYRLGQKGIRSIILEAAPSVAGLGGCCEVGGALVERFYHHIKPEDRHIIDLIGELGLGDNLEWTDTRMGFYHGGTVHPFSTALDLLRFGPFSPLDRVRFALGTLRARRTDGRTLDGMDAKEWIVREWSQGIYDRMMGPLIRNKFGIPPEDVSAAFIHGRIKGLSSAKSNPMKGEVLGYLRGSVQPLTDRFEAAVNEVADIRLRAPVERVEKTAGGFTVWSDGTPFAARYIVNTLPLHVFDKIDKNFLFNNDVEYVGVVCAIFSLKKHIIPVYWLNIIEEGISFRLLVNQSALGEYDNQIIYCANYVRETDSLFGKSEEDIMRLYLDDLRKMFGDIVVDDRVLFRARHATPIFDKDFGRKVADLDTRIPGMVFAGNIKVYPGSRTLSSVMGTGYNVADQIAGTLSSTSGPA